MIRLFFLLVIVCVQARAEVVRKVDPITGHVTYTNLRPGTDVDPEPIVPMRRAATQYVPREPKLAVVPAVRPVNFPSISPEVQKQRDHGRLRILMDELRSELSSLEIAEEKKADAETVNRHRSNIASLKREIKNIK